MRTKSLRMSVCIGVALFAGCSSSTAPSTETGGALKIGVTWNTAADIDLHVLEPSGAEIYWGNTSSASGGMLDVDANEFCTQNAGANGETITWPTGAPSGTYTVRLDYYQNCGAASTNYTVTVTNGMSVTTFTGTFTGIGDVGANGSGTLITTVHH